MILLPEELKTTLKWKSASFSQKIARRQTPKYVILELKQAGLELFSLKLGNCILPVSSANLFLFPRLSQTVSSG